jgi:hypothetical protein
VQRVRLRFWVEAAFAGLAGALGLLTLITREWIEAVFGVDPDGGSGSLEWGLVVVLLLAALVVGAAARAEWRHVQPGPELEGAR